ncbi:MAG: twin-arginine translocase subunit TatB [Sinobacterium sp.]|nr:twin-arginine translocase subunit TatB [Sinobacterium sp.]
MFDIGFIELLMVGIVGLIVLGPERLPIAIRQIALYVGRLKRLYRTVKSDIEKEVGADEIRRQLHNEEIMSSLNTTKDELQSVVNDINPQHVNNKPMNKENPTDKTSTTSNE